MSTAIRLKPPGEQWMQFAELGVRRVVPGSVSLTADDAGPLSGSFTLTAPSGDPIPALLPFTPVVAEIDGLQVWSGFVRVPTRSAQAVNVEVTGDQAHLDGDSMVIVPADAQLTSWDNSLCVAGNWSFQGTQQGGQQSIVIGWPNDSATVFAASGEFNGVTYVAAVGQIMAVRVTVAFSQSIGARFVVVGHDGLTNPASGPWVRLIDIPDSSSGIFTGDTGGRNFRYISMGYTATPSSIPTGTQVTIPSVLACDRAGYLTSLVGSDVAGRVHDLVPQLSPDTSRIQATSFQIPHIERANGDVARAILTEAAAYDDTRVAVDAFGRLIFAPYPHAAAVEFGHDCPADGESPQDPSVLASVVDVTGTTTGGQAIRRRYSVLDDSQRIVTAAGSVSNPDFASGVTGWTTSGGTVLTRGTTDPPAGLTAWAEIDNTVSPGSTSWAANEFIETTMAGTYLAGIPYRVDIQAFDASAAALTKARSLTIRVVDPADTQGLVEMTVELQTTPTTPYGWRTFSLTWVPRIDVTGPLFQIYNSPTIPAFEDGMIANYATFPRFTGLRIYSTATLLTRQRVQRVGGVQVPVIASEQVAKQIGVSFLRGASRLGFTGTRTCADGAARDAVTGAQLPAAALLGMTGSIARVADRLDPDTGAMGARAFISQVVYDGASRTASVTLGSRYGAAAQLVADLGTP